MSLESAVVSPYRAMSRITTLNCSSSPRCDQGGLAVDACTRKRCGYSYAADVASRTTSASGRFRLDRRRPYLSKSSNAPSKRMRRGDFGVDEPAGVIVFCGPAPAKMSSLFNAESRKRSSRKSTKMRSGLLFRREDFFVPELAKCPDRKASALPWSAAAEGKPFALSMNKRKYKVRVFVVSNGRPKRPEVTECSSGFSCGK